MHESVQDLGENRKDPSLFRFKNAIHNLVVESIRTTLKDEPQLYAEAVLPNLLPALKKNISTLMNDVVESFQKILEKSLSFDSLKWRFEALRTGKSFAEIAVFHSLRYRVNQVLLIDSNSGLLMSEATLATGDEADPDLISGMITAVMSFVQDSFRTNSDSDQKTRSEAQGPSQGGSFRYAEYLIWTEIGRHATLAALISGQPGPEYREILRSTLSEVEKYLFHSTNRVERTSPDVQETTNRLLNRCLQVDYLPQKKRKSTSRLIAIATLIVLVLLPLIPIGLSYRSKQLFLRYEKALRGVPGIVITHAERKKDQFYFFGIRDPYSNDPYTILVDAGLDPRQAMINLQYFKSEEPMLIRHRFISSSSELNRKLEGISLRFDLGSVELSKVAQQRLREVSNQLIRLDELSQLIGRQWELVVQGSSDLIGDSRINKTLSFKRALSTATFLEQLGVPRDRIKSVGLGATKESERTVRLQLRLLKSGEVGRNAS